MKSCPLIDEKKEFEAGQPSTCAVFTSASTVKGFVEGTKGLDYSQGYVLHVLENRRRAAAESLMECKAYMSEKATIDSLDRSWLRTLKRSE